MSSRYVPLGPFTNTATGDLGEKRDTMLVNQLLLRDKVGQHFERGICLPGKGHNYGLPNEVRFYTAVDALRAWPDTRKTTKDKPDKKKRLGRNFMALNRAAVSAGMVTAPENYDYRTTHDIRLKHAPDILHQTTKFPPGMAFGLPPRPSTPMFDLLEHKYQDKWIEKMYIARKADEAKHSRKKVSNYETRTNLLRTYQNPVDPVPLWQMPRFASNAKPHLQTFRSSRDRENAKTHFELDSVSRKGVFGQGVYEKAQN
ncbi:cilia- and flagella-associated protein 77-like [Babylonia areolata]|uniref:cilia- and flagella-associated protein 77-like n=1 Tax=Babylonia areolata TaxID=304850 RepID=UPI003FD698DF